MRVLYIFIVLFIHTQISGMKQVTQCPVDFDSAAFAKSLLRVAGQAQLKRVHENKTNKETKDGTKVTKVPQKLCELVEPHVKNIISCFDKASSSVKPLSELIMEYIGDEYALHRNLCFIHFDGYEQVIRLYPCIGLIFDEDGHNLHAQLGESRRESSLQLVRWNLFKDCTKFEQLQDYELGSQLSTSDNVSQEICVEYMWWKAIAKNTFKGKNYSPVNLLQVQLYYNLTHMIKALVS